jgi:Trk-type K+ transport system membrane component
MNLVIFILVLLASIVVVAIGAVLFELTGMHWPQAKFQAISCFTSTGFTTKESEIVMINARRRRIASVLMILGNAGFITLFATVVNSFTADSVFFKYKLPIIDFVVPEKFWPLANLLTIMIAGYFIYKIISHTKISKFFINFIKNRLESQKRVKKVTFEEMVMATGGFGALSIEVKNKSHLVGKTIKEAQLAGSDIKVLAIERNQESIAFPKEAERIENGDKIICFGDLKNLKDKLAIKNQA